MAQTKYGALITDFKGKVGGTVFQGGFAAKITKNKPSFVPQKNNLTLPKRAQLTTLASMWRKLTPEQQNAWDSIKSLWLFKNKFGESYEGSGYQVFIAYNLNLAVINREFVQEPSAPVELFDPGELTLSLKSDNTGWLLLQYEPPTGYVAQMMFSRPQPYPPKKKKKPTRENIIEETDEELLYYLGMKPQETWGIQTEGWAYQISLIFRHVDWPYPGPERMVSGIIQPGGVEYNLNVIVRDKDDDFAYVEGAEVRVFNAETSFMIRSGNTNSSGAVLFEELPVKDVFIRVIKEGYITYESEPFELSGVGVDNYYADIEQEVVLNFTVEGIITINELGGSPLSGATVVLLDPISGNPIIDTITAGNGRYEITGVEESTIRIRVQKEGWVTKTSDPIDISVTQPFEYDQFLEEE
jgi:hypothetical protein